MNCRFYYTFCPNSMNLLIYVSSLIGWINLSVFYRSNIFESILIIYKNDSKAVKKGDSYLH